MQKLLTLGGALLLLTNCTTIQAVGSETENARCEVLGEALPTRSRLDTAQTQSEIDNLYSVYEAACPDHGYLVPE